MTKISISFDVSDENAKKWQFILDQLIELQKKIYKSTYEPDILMYLLGLSDIFGHVFKILFIGNFDTDQTISVLQGKIDAFKSDSGWE